MRVLALEETSKVVLDNGCGGCRRAARGWLASARQMIIDI
jgi:bacterioferritin-associated ferredoxin